MNFIRAASLRVGDVVHIPNNGEWTQTTGKITSIIKGDITGLLTVYLEKGLSFRIFPSGQVPFVIIGNTPNNQNEEQNEEQNMKPLGELDKSQLKLLKESLMLQFDKTIDEERFNPSRTIEQLEEYNQKLNEWIKVNDLITRTIIYLKE